MVQARLDRPTISLWSVNNAQIGPHKAFAASQGPAEQFRGPSRWIPGCQCGGTTAVQTHAGVAAEAVQNSANIANRATPIGWLTRSECSVDCQHRKEAIITS